MFKICLKYFIISRIFYIFFIIIPFNKFLVGENDLSNNLIEKKLSFENEENFKYYNETESAEILSFEKFPILEKNILKFLKHFNSYDTIHFLHIAKYKYTNEKNFVFFPLFPKIIEYTENIFLLKFLFNFQSDYTSFLIIGFLISNLLCLLNSFLLSRYIYKKKLTLGYLFF